MMNIKRDRNITCEKSIFISGSITTAKHKFVKEREEELVRRRERKKEKRKGKGEIRRKVTQSGEGEIEKKNEKGQKR